MTFKRKEGNLVIESKPRKKNIADLVLLNCKVYTMNDDLDVEEAVAVKGNKIICVGTEEDVKKLIGDNTCVLNLEGKPVLPGFEDCHCHLISYGLSLSQVDLSDLTDIKNLLKRVEIKAKNLPNDFWIRGHSWDQEKMGGNWPTRFDLDSVSPNNPVLLTRICCHIAVANSKALELAGISKETPDPVGGEIERDKVTGEVTGLLKDSAIDLVEKVIPQATRDEIKTAIKLITRKALEKGVTSIEDVGVGWEEVNIYSDLYLDGELGIRMSFLIDVGFLDEMIKRSMRSPYPLHKGWVNVTGVKVFADGSLGGRTAYLKEPYLDRLDTCGLPMLSQDDLNKIVLKANQFGIQVAVHAIGDAANEMVIKAFENSLSSIGYKKYSKLRNRIEHCSVLNDFLLSKYKELGVLASIQLSFEASDRNWIIKRVGKERIRYVYAWRSLLDSDLVCIGGTDCPIEVLDPIIGLYNVSNRERGIVDDDLYLQQKISVREGLELITKNAAYGTFEEDVKGTIEVGKYADMVVLSKDLLEVGREEILNAKVLMTIVDGKILFDIREKG
ncbi:MAG: amidohydrolase [Nitrososphaeria archaeon]